MNQKVVDMSVFRAKHSKEEVESMMDFYFDLWKVVIDQQHMMAQIMIDSMWGGIEDES